MFDLLHRVGLAQSDDPLMDLKARGSQCRAASMPAQRLPDAIASATSKEVGCGARAPVERTTGRHRLKIIMTLNRAYHSQKGGAMRSKSQ